MDLSNALNARLSNIPIDHLDTLELWSLYKIDKILGSIEFVKDSSFRQTLKKRIHDAYSLPAKMQLHEILEDPNLTKQLEALPQESSELQNLLRQTGVYNAIITQIRERRGILNSISNWMANIIHGHYNNLKIDYVMNV